jgi:Uma2 family endonuclease
VNAVQLRRWSREEYGRMIDAGVLTAEDQVELIDGEIVTMTPQKSRHATAVQLAQIAVGRAFGVDFSVRAQLPLALDPDSEPEPDIAVVTGSPRDYREEHPSTALLILEVADTSLALDRTVKASIYARAGIVDYWIVNLADETLEIHRTPEGSTDVPPGWRYAMVERFGARKSVAPLARPDGVISVADLLP